MKEWLKKMAKELGLPETASETEITAKLGEKILGGQTAESRLSSVAGALGAKGFKLHTSTEQVKLVETEKPPVVETDELKALREDVRLGKVETAKVRLAAAKAEVAAIMAQGTLPPTVKDALTRIMSSTGRVESVALSASGDDVVKSTVDVLADIRLILSSLPAVTGGRLKQLAALPPEGDAKDKESAKALASAVADRVKGKKVEKK